ncbi:hypothetical protein D918_05276 [Trichuris suis]|nr:hypothetical protein D918_05276 [Trichuris suis]
MENVGRGLINWNELRRCCEFSQDFIVVCGFLSHKMVVTKLLPLCARIASRSFCKRAAEFKGMINAGPREDPVFWSPPTEWHTEGEKYRYSYRLGYTGETHKFDRLVTKYYISGLFWGYMLYRLYYDYMEVIGEPEWPLPRLEKFTNEELGIPDDDSVAPRLYGAAVV